MMESIFHLLIKNIKSSFSHVVSNLHKKKYEFSLMNSFFVKSRLKIYSNMERKGQYTGWVEVVVILGSIHGPKLRDITEYSNPDP